MTGKNAGRRGLFGGIAGATIAAGLVLSSAAAYADPDPAPAPTTPVAEPAPAPYAEPAGPKAIPQTGAPAPTVAVAGGAAAGAKAAASSAAAAAPQPGDVLDQLAEEYAVGSGGGQLSNLLKTVLKLRAMGYRPSKPYLDEIKEAMTHRPNQLPLIGALKDTIAYQQKIQAQTQVLQNAQAKAAPPVDPGVAAAAGINGVNNAPQAVAPGMPAAPAPPVITPATP